MLLNKKIFFLELTAEEIEIILTKLSQSHSKEPTVKKSDNLHNPQERYIDKKEAAKIAYICSNTIDNWANAGKISRHRFGSRVRFYLPDFLEFLADQKELD